MFKPSRILLVPALTALVFSTAQAQLVFDKTAIELHPAIGDEKAVAHFMYQNKGDKPVAIQNVSTSCGCTAASAKQSAAPGEKGEVTATFSIGDRVGTQQKIITVMTDDSRQPTTQLHLTVVIPQALELKTPLVIWYPNEAPKPKTIEAKAGKDVSVKSVEVASSNPDFTAKVEPGSAPGEYKISVQPKATNQAIYATLTIKPLLADGKTKMVYATARVMPPPPTPAPAATAAAPNAAATPIAEQGKFTACSLLTSQEIQSVQGEPLKQPVGSSNNVKGLLSSQCYFDLPTSSNSISLTITQRAGGPDARSPKQFWDQTFHRDQDEEKEHNEKTDKEHGKMKNAGEEEERTVPPKKVDGVGDEAFWAGSRVGGSLYVLKGDTIVRVSVGGAGDEAAKIDKSKKLAQMVLKKL